MRVEIRGWNGVVGTVVLHGDRAVPDEGARKLLDGVVVVSRRTASKPRRQLTYQDGREYLEALPHCLKGSYLWATLPMD